jgi:hypothetical protein
MNEFDQFVKHMLRQRYYLRYTDDFVILGSSPEELQGLLAPIADFLVDELRLTLHPGKVSIRKLSQGIDFLGYVVRPHHTVLRTKTKRRMLKWVNQTNVDSYLGLLQHCQGYQLRILLESLKDE